MKSFQNLRALILSIDVENDVEILYDIVRLKTSDGMVEVSNRLYRKCRYGCPIGHQIARNIELSFHSDKILLKWGLFVNKCFERITSDANYKTGCLQDRVLTLVEVVESLPLEELYDRLYTWWATTPDRYIVVSTGKTRKDWTRLVWRELTT